MAGNGVVFRRIRGHIVPIKQSEKAHIGGVVKGLAKGIVGAGLSLSAMAISAKLGKFGRLARLFGAVGTVFAGEALAADGFDQATESLRLKSPRTEQTIKNITAGTLGVIGLLSGGAILKNGVKKPAAILHLVRK